MVVKYLYFKDIKSLTNLYFTDPQIRLIFLFLSSKSRQKEMFQLLLWCIVCFIYSLGIFFALENYLMYSSMLFPRNFDCYVLLQKKSFVFYICVCVLEYC